VGLFDGSTPEPSRAFIRDTLYADLPLDLWPSGNTEADAFPWGSFIAARRHVAASEIDFAKQCWLQVISASGLESRHYAQAWHFLRQHGSRPPVESAKVVLGVVVEVGMAKGLDLLAAYPDHHARYYNFSGAGVIRERADASLDPIIDALLTAAAQVVGQIEPWEKERPGPPPSGQMRISFLTPSGLHFRQAAIEALPSDPLAGPVAHVAEQLLQTLMAKHPRMKGR
jgi:hypothetical protein